MGHSRDVQGRRVKHVFKIQLTNTLSLLLQITQDFIVNGSGEKFSEQFIVQTII